MRHQIAAILWAQFRVSRNHFPRTTAGSLISWMLSFLWYCLYGLMAVVLILKVPDVPLFTLEKWLPAGLLGVFLFWQIIPLFTLSSGWSLQLDKLQVYPVSTGSLFGIEFLLRITAAPEMLIVIVGTMVGLLRHPAIPWFSPLSLLLFIPFNLLLQLAVRDLVLHSFERNRFRELFTVLVISIAILPQMLLRTGLGRKMQPYFLTVAQHAATPWYEDARLSLGHGSALLSLALLAWLASSYGFALWMFRKSLESDDGFGTASLAPATLRQSSRSLFSAWPVRVFRDPLASLVQKELQSLIRMPRFRVMFGMACVLGAVVFVPLTLRGSGMDSSFMKNNLLPVVNMYGLLLLSDALLLNAFGFDRGAAQAYFVTPVQLKIVLKAKNLTAVFFVICQTVLILCVAAILRVSVTPVSFSTGVLASAVVTVFLISIGNYTSLAYPRPMDPKQTFRKQAGAKMQLWLLGSSLSLFILVGFAFLARYAFARDWVLPVVLLVEFLVGLLVYRFSLESAVTRGLRNRESIVEALSKSASPVSVG